MNTVFFLMLRRLRVPLILLILAYAISVGGLVLIPGVDPTGQPWRFDFFHAFYFVSYTASTIGFGEIPYAFTPAQRLWVTLSIYLTVFGWLYAFGNILALLQDPAFRRALAEQRFARRVRRMPEPFYIVCGYGETGALIARLLARNRIRAIAIDRDPERVAAIDLEDVGVETPALCGDAHDPAVLVAAGLHHRHCLGVVPVTGDDEANVEVAMSAKLLNPRLRVVCRAETAAARAKLPSFHAEQVIDPFETFGEQLALALQKPSVHMLYEYLGGLPGEPLPTTVTPPRGLWLICGYGRFGRAVDRYLTAEGAVTRIIEPDSARAPPGALVAAGTDIAALAEAGIAEAVGVIAGTDSDTSNLAIALTARALNRDLFLVARENLDRNHALFAAAPIDLTMDTSRIIVRRIVAELLNPLVRRFLELASTRDEAWAAAICTRIQALCGGRTPDTWAVALNETDAPAVTAALEAGREVTLAHLSADPRARSEALPCVPLLLARRDLLSPLPAPDTTLERNDCILFTGPLGTAQRQEWVLGAANVLEYVEAGIEYPDGHVWRWLTRSPSRTGPVL